MEEKLLIRNGNRLDVEFHVSRGSSEEPREVAKSREYVINGLVVCLVMMDIEKDFHPNNKPFAKYRATVCIKFRETIKPDAARAVSYGPCGIINELRPVTHAIKCYSEQLKMNNPITLHNDESWGRLYTFNNDNWLCTFEFNFKLTVEVVIGTSSLLAPLHNDTNSTDFELRGIDGSVRVHKIFLVARSEVFRKMFTHEWRDIKDGSVEETTKETLQHLKDYIYMGKLPEKSLELEQLRALASRYMMEHLVERCSFILSAQKASELEDLAAVTYKTRHDNNTIKNLGHL